MSSSTKYLSIYRMVTFSTTILFSLIVLSISAAYISLTAPAFDAFSGLSLSTGLLTFLTVTILLVVDLFRQGSFFSYIIVEIVWLSILWVLWLSSGSYSAWVDGQAAINFPGESNCDFSIFANINDTQGCHEIKAIMAFSFLIWILLMPYTITLLALAIRAQTRGNSSWTTGVRDGVLFYSAGKSMGGAAQVQATAPTIPYSQAPPQQPLPQQPLPQQPLLQQTLSQQTLPQQQSYPSYPSPYPTAQV